MTRKEVEILLPTMSSRDREQALRMLEHSCSFYDPVGRHIPHDYEKENLLDVISKCDTYAIDTCSEWKKECRLAENQNKAFIISPALSRENPNTKDLILDKTRAKLGNIFSIGLISSVDGSSFRVQVDRIDEGFYYVFDKEKIAEASKDTPENTAKRKADAGRMNLNQKRELLRIIGFGKASELPPPTDPILTGLIQGFKESIARLVPECKYDVNKSKKLVNLCYLLLLMEDTQPKKNEGPRAEFDMADYEHVFGDMYVVQTAIYLRSNILTRDAGVKKMASYAGINSYQVARTA